MVFSFLLTSITKVKASEIVSGLTVNRAIGYSVNAVTSDYADPIKIKTGSPILEPSFLQSLFDEGRVIRTDLAMDTPVNTTFTSRSFTGISTQVSASYNTSLELPFVYDIFAVRLSAGFSADFSYEFSNYSNKFYYLKNFRTKTHKLDLPDYSSNLSEYQSNLHPNFTATLDLLEAGKIEYKDFFDTYGTHFIASAIYGAELDIMYSLCTNETVITKSLEDSIRAKVDAGILGLGDANASVDVSTKVEEMFTGIDYKDAFSARSRGGAHPFGYISEADFSSSYLNWNNSITSENAGLIEYGEDGLIEIKKLIPQTYTNIHGKILDEFNNYAKTYNKGISSDFKFDESFYPDVFVPKVDTIEFENNWGILIRDKADTVHDTGFNGFENDVDTVNVADKFDVNFSVMKNLGYKYVTVQIRFDCREIHPGYQQVFLYSKSTENLAYQLYMDEFEHGGNGSANTTWKERIHTTPKIDINKFVDPTNFYIRWDAHGQNDDDWRNDDVYIKLTFSKK
ncbi:hypothetical protein KHQ81_11640 [Mycoplasmatota bacterium]|nr:hypothetical protein KHQ81_11640 [Mycoplasmatota bacterium]